VTKILGGKAYGSIPHLLGSRMGAGDHHVHEGQHRILTERCRKREYVEVQEKLDGSCVAVARVGDDIHALGRAGHLARSSPYEQHRLFAGWVDLRRDRFLDVLNDGERLIGEWLAQAHGTRYELPHEPFVVFDLLRDGHKRMSLARLNARLGGLFVQPRLIHRGAAIAIGRILELLEPSGHGALDPVEGAVWRLNEQASEGDTLTFIAKYVRPDKQDGSYLPDLTNQPPIWNWRPERTDWLLDYGQGTTPQTVDKVG